MIILGIDIGVKNFGFALFKDDKLIDTQTVVLQDPSECRLVIEKFVAREKPDLVIVEQVPYGVAGNQLVNLSSVLGRICQILEDLGLKYKLVQPSYWKKKVFGTAVLTKRQIRDFFKEKFGLKKLSYHASDAIGIALSEILC